MSRFLEKLSIERYGGFVERDVGPFSPGLNVVFGPNEAGKSTIASFIGGVLFGWEDGHGVQNTYSPKTGERSGTLFFSDGTTANRSGESGAMGGDAHPTNDVDAVTFKTIFSLTADELRSLRGSSDVTARLLTAGSGTGASPAGAFVEIEQRIAKLVSRSSEDPDSVYNLEDALDEQREQVKQLADEEARRKREDVELHTLLEDREITSRHLSDVSRTLEKLSAGRVRIEQIDQQAVELEHEIALAEKEREEQEAGQPENGKIDPKLMQLDAIAERSLRDKLDEYSDEQAKATRGIDIAKENAATSAAAYEALLEMDSEALQNKNARREKSMLAALPGALAAGFALAGIPVFVHARAINSLSLTALGIGLVVFACLLAIAAVALVARPDKSVEALTTRQQDAQWVMLQDKKKLDTNTAAKQLLDAEVASFLDDAGLAAANGSIRQARALLDDAREIRSGEQVRQQRIASLDMREASARKDLDEIAVERKDLMKTLGFDCKATVDDISDEIALKQEQQQALAQTCDDMNRRIGELTERLDQARGDSSFDLAKLRYQQTRVRLRDAKHELVTLLLA
ncbi:MAG: AAA family ATPase, partial [Eggerthellaceae bacterium]|nr:AAA family ATPase [Eggerthellaceae bacterium]